MLDTLRLVEEPSVLTNRAILVDYLSAAAIARDITELNIAAGKILEALHLLP